MATNIVWIHGFPLSLRVFDPQRAIGGITHVAPDLPGFGGAPPPAGNMTMERYARYVLDQSPRDAVFAGLSMGGYICFAIARIAPKRMKGLILIDTRETADTPEGRKGRYDMIAKVENEGIDPVVDSMLPKMVINESLKPQVRAIMESSSKEGVIAALRAMAERPDSTDLLPSLGFPALIVVGMQDPITPPSDADRMAKALRNSKLERIPNAAHLSNLEQPDVFNAAVKGFIDAL
jgi:pimeloyl-ACP methyl ester carboxylesterase